jgi:hypothetical protein
MDGNFTDMSSRLNPLVTVAIHAIRNWLTSVYIGGIHEEEMKREGKTVHWNCTIPNHALPCGCGDQDRTKMYFRSGMVEKLIETGEGRKTLLALQAWLLCASCGWKEDVEHLDYISKQIPIDLDWTWFAQLFSKLDAATKKSDT